MYFIVILISFLSASAAHAAFDIVRSDFPTADFKSVIHSHYLWRGEGYQKLAVSYGGKDADACQSVLQEYRAIALNEMLKRGYLTPEQFDELLQMVQTHDHRQVVFFTSRSTLKVKDVIPQDRETREKLRENRVDPEGFLSSQEVHTSDHPIAIASRVYGGKIRSTLWLVRAQTTDGKIKFNLPWQRVEFLKPFVAELTSGILLSWEVGSAYSSELNMLEPTFEMAALTALQEATELRVPLNQAMIYMRSIGTAHTKHYHQSSTKLQELKKNPDGPDSLLGVRLSDLDWNRILRSRHHLIQKYFETYPQSTHSPMDVFELLNAYSRVVIQAFGYETSLPTPILVKSHILVAAAVWFGQAKSAYPNWTAEELMQLFDVGINGIPQLPTERVALESVDIITQSPEAMVMPDHGWQIEGLSAWKAMNHPLYSINAVRAVYLYKLNQLHASNAHYYQNRLGVKDGITVVTQSPLIADQLVKQGGVELVTNINQEEWRDLFFSTDRPNEYTKPTKITGQVRRIYFDGTILNTMSPKSKLEAMALFQLLQSHTLPNFGSR